MEGQPDAHIGLYDVDISLQRVRDVLVVAETYCPLALH